MSEFRISEVELFWVRACRAVNGAPSASQADGTWSEDRDLKVELFCGCRRQRSVTAVGLPRAKHAPACRAHRSLVPSWCQA